jgi:hypothetical protein
MHGLYCRWFWFLLHVGLPDGKGGYTKLHEEKSVPMGAGSLTHDTMRDYGVHCLTTGKTSDTEALPTLFRDVCLRSPDATPEAVALAQTHLDEIASHYEFPVEPGQQWWCERTIWWRFKSPDGNRVMVESRIDLLRVIGTHAVITDYKLRRRMLSREDFEANLQLPTYACSVLGQFPALQNIEGDFAYLILNTQQFRHITQQDMNAALSFLGDAADAICRGKKALATGAKPEDVFPATPGRACEEYDGYPCPMVRHCVYHKQRHDFTINSPDEARALLADYIQGKVTLDAQWDALANWQADPNNPRVVCNGKTVDFRPTRTYKPDNDKLIAWLQEQGREWWEAGKFDSKTAAKNGVLDTLIGAGVVTETLGTTAKLVNAKEDK